MRLRGYARFAYEHIARLKGFWCKVGQYLSSRADVLPRPFVRELGKVQDSMPSTAFEDVKQIVEEQSGASLEQLFSSFEEKPLASASIAQVH